jgi:hypothetical protein
MIEADVSLTLKIAINMINSARDSIINTGG